MSTTADSQAWAGEVPDFPPLIIPAKVVYCAKTGKPFPWYGRGRPSKYCPEVRAEMATAKLSALRAEKALREGKPIGPRIVTCALTGREFQYTGRGRPSRYHPDVREMVKLEQDRLSRERKSKTSPVAADVLA